MDAPRAEPAKSDSVRESTHGVSYLAAATQLVRRIDSRQLDRMARGLAEVRRREGGCSSSVSAAGPATHRTRSTTSASSARSRATRPTDNVSELTARTNDDGWETSFSAWLGGLASVCARRAARLLRRRRLARARRVGQPRATRWRWRASRRHALRRRRRARRDARRARRRRDRCIEPPPALRTPLVESFQAVVWHALVSHPDAGRRNGPLGVARRCRDAVSAAGGVPRSRRRAQRAGRRPRLGGCPESPLRVEDVRLVAGRSRGRPAPDAGRLSCWCASPTSPPRPRAGSRSQQLLRRARACARAARAARASRSPASRLCLHHPDGRRSASSPGSAATAASRRPACCSTRPRRWASTWPARGWWETPTPMSQAGQAAGCRTLLICHPGSVHKRLQAIGADLVADEPRRGSQPLSSQP